MEDESNASNPYPADDAPAESDESHDDAQSDAPTSDVKEEDSGGASNESGVSASVEDDSADDEQDSGASDSSDAPASPAPSPSTPAASARKPGVPRQLGTTGGFSSRSRGISSTPRMPMSSPRSLPIPSSTPEPKKDNKAFLAPAPRPEPPSGGKRKAEHIGAFRTKSRFEDGEGPERDPNANYDDDPRGAPETPLPDPAEVAAQEKAEKEAAEKAAAEKAKAEAENAARVKAEQAKQAAARAAAEAKSKDPSDGSFAVQMDQGARGEGVSREMLDAMGVGDELKLADDRVYTEGGYVGTPGSSGSSADELLRARREGRDPILPKNASGGSVDAALAAVSGGEPLRFGEAGIKLNIVNDAQVNEALSIQRAQIARNEEPQKIGQILLSRGSLDDDDVKKILNYQAIRDIAESIPGFKIVQKIGEGAMGAVYKAKQVRLDRWVAIKVLNPELAANEELRQRFIQEARVAARLNHPNIIGGIDAGDVGGLCYFAMEFVDGQTVADLVKTHGPMPIDAALRVVVQVAHALEHASQQGMIHRDIKPHNIMLNRAGVAKLLDLGLAKINAAVMRTKHPIPERSAVGTPNFISPEQARGDSDIDQRSDFYSLGVTLFYMLSGRTPFYGAPAEVLKKHISEPPPDLRTLREGLPEPVYHLVMRMMAKMKEVRPRTASQLAQDADNALAQIGGARSQPAPAPAPQPAVAPRPVGPAQPGGSARLPRKRRRRPY